MCSETKAKNEHEIRSVPRAIAPYTNEYKLNIHEMRMFSLLYQLNFETEFVTQKDEIYSKSLCLRGAQVPWKINLLSFFFILTSCNNNDAL